MVVVSRIDTPKLVIKYDGIFDFDGLYKTASGWIIGQGYRFAETSVKHKIPTPAGIELEYVWTAWRKHNVYTKYWILMLVKFYDMKELDVIKDGEKKRLTKARILIEMNGELEFDWTKRFGGNRFVQQLNDFLQHQILMKPMEGVIGSMWWDELYYRTYKLHNIIKEYLNMEGKGNAYFDMW